MEVIIHYIIPLLFLLAFFPKINKKKAAIFALIAVAIDLDFFVREYHRAIFYNIFFIIIFCFIIYKLVDKEGMYLSLYYIFSHLLFDLGKPGIALFYPLIKKTFYFNFDILEINNIPKFIIDYGTINIPGKIVEKPSYYLNNQGMLMILLVLVLFIIKYRKNIQRGINKKFFNN
jgi:hypothetical protein